MVQAKMGYFTFKTIQVEKKKYDEAIAKNIYARNIPFSHVENFYFKKMIPGYEPFNSNSVGWKNSRGYDGKKKRMKYTKC